MDIRNCENEEDVCHQTDQVDVMSSIANVDADCGNNYLTRKDINGITIDLTTSSLQYGCIFVM